MDDMFASEPPSGVQKLISTGAFETSEADAFQRMCWLIAEALDLPGVIVSLGHGQRYWMQSSLDGTAEEYLELLTGLEEAVVPGDIFEVSDAKLDPDFFDAPLVEQDEGGIRFVSGAILTDSTGFQCGVIGVFSDKPRILSQSHRTMLRCFVDQIENEIKLLTLMQEEADLRIEVSKAFNVKSNFLSHMSHEIRTPISGIIGATDLLLREIKDEEPVTLLNTVRSSATDLMQLLNETLDSAKVEAGGLHIKREPVDIVRLMRKMENHFVVLADSKGLEFEVVLEVPENMPSMLYTDETRLRQIMFNIVHNAMKFTNVGKVACRLAVTCNEQCDKCLILFEVVDTGIGMSDDVLVHLFEPFRQGEEGDERQYGGIGIGMSLVKQLVQHMDGQIEVASTVGEGSSFQVTLPTEGVEDVWIVEPNVDKEQNNAGVDRLAEQEIDLTGTQVLIADDNPQNRLILEKVVSSWGCDVTVVADGIQALEEARKHVFDALILDLHMPGCSGFQVARTMRDLSSSIRLIACSADDTEAAFAKCRDSGFDYQLQKPFNWSKVYAALASVAEPDARSQIQGGGIGILEYA